jgi:hypothetical protein
MHLFPLSYAPLMGVCGAFIFAHLLITSGLPDRIRQIFGDELMTKGSAIPLRPENSC